LDDGPAGQRIDAARVTEIADVPRAGEPIRAVHVHCATAADTLPARAPEGERRVDVVLDPDQRIEHHRPALIEIDLEGVEPGILTGRRVITIAFERFDASGACRGWPSLSLLDARLRSQAEILRNRKPLEQPRTRNLF